MTPRRATDIARAVLIVAGGMFLVLAALVALFGALPGDAWVRDALLAWAAPGLVQVLRVVNRAGSWPVLLPAALLLFASPRMRRAWWIWIPALVLTPLIEGSAKFVVGRARPEAPAYGFPSGHAAAAAAYLGVACYAASDLPPRLRRAVQIAAAIVVVLVALARVILRAHWPSDSLGGIALGLACAAAAVLICESIPRTRPAPMSPPPPSRG